MFSIVLVSHILCSRMSFTRLSFSSSPVPLPVRIKSQSPIRAALFYRKPKVFRRNYLIIGDEFSLETFYGQKISADVLSEASKIIGQKFDELREKFDALLTEKGVKKIENPSA